MGASQNVFGAHGVNLPPVCPSGQQQSYDHVSSPAHDSDSESVYITVENGPLQPPEEEPGEEEQGDDDAHDSSGEVTTLGTLLILPTNFTILGF